MMKKNTVFIVSLLIVLGSVRQSYAFLPLPTIDFSSIAEEVSTVIEQIKSSKVIVDTTKTIGEISSSIGDAVATVTKFTDEAKAEYEKAMKAKQQIEEYAAEAKKYKEYTEEKIEKAKAMYEEAQNLKATMEEMSSQDVLSGLKSKAGAIADSYGLPSPEEFYNKQNDAVEENESANANEEVSTNDDESITKEEASKKVPVKFGEKGTSGVATEKAKALEKDVKQEKKADKLQEDNGLKSSNSERIKAVQNALTSANAMSKDLPGGKARSNINKVVSGASKVAPSKIVKDKALAIDKKTDKKKEPVSGISTPSKLFKKSSQNNEVLNTKIATYRQKFVFSFAAAQQDKSKLNTGKAKNGVQVIPEEMAKFCEMSMSDVESDPHGKIKECIKKMVMQKDDEDTPMDKQSLLLVKKQAASASLASSYKGAQDLKKAMQNVQDYDKKSESVSSNRDISSMTPFYTVEMARALNGYTSDRTVAGIYKIIYDVENIKVED